jgi:hypothetical protein
VPQNVWAVFSPNSNFLLRPKSVSTTWPDAKVEEPMYIYTYI